MITIDAGSFALGMLAEAFAILIGWGLGKCLKRD